MTQRSSSIAPVEYSTDHLCLNFLAIQKPLTTTIYNSTDVFPVVSPVRFAIVDVFFVCFRLLSTTSLPLSLDDACILRETISWISALCRARERFAESSQGEKTGSTPGVLGLWPGFR